jgi:hypothetical protein
MSRYPDRLAAVRIPVIDMARLQRVVVFAGYSPDTEDNLFLRGVVTTVVRGVAFGVCR